MTDKSPLLVVDAANVVGSRPNGWWRDRAKAAADFCDELTAAVAAGRLDAAVVVVLEGAARTGVREGQHGALRVVHATGSGDDTIVEVVTEATANGIAVTAVSADRELRTRVARAGAELIGPKWLHDRL